MVSIADSFAAVSVWRTVARARSSVVPTRLHAVAADGHRAPAGGVRLAAVDEEPPAFRVRARPEPAGAGDPQRVPGQHGARRPLGPPSTARCQSMPSRRRGGRRATGSRKAQRCRRLLTAHDVLQRRAYVEQRRHSCVRRRMPRAGSQGRAAFGWPSSSCGTPSSTGVVFSRSSSRPRRRAYGHQIHV